ncbi:hypothetical protein SUGI_1131270 [Cryptomeria japonica]|nr:hypothetical protein SUGI_1131270 [Cryptomeria japonica]
MHVFRREAGLTLKSYVLFSFVDAIDPHSIVNDAGDTDLQNIINDAVKSLMPVKLTHKISSVMPLKLICQISPMLSVKLRCSKLLRKVMRKSLQNFCL